MNITEIPPEQKKAVQAYEDWMDVDNNRYGSMHREAFMTAYATGYEAGNANGYQQALIDEFSRENQGEEQ